MSKTKITEESRAEVAGRVASLKEDLNVFAFLEVENIPPDENLTDTVDFFSLQGEFDDVGYVPFRAFLEAVAGFYLSVYGAELPILSNSVAKHEVHQWYESTYQRRMTPGFTGESGYLAMRAYLEDRRRQSRLDIEAKPSSSVSPYLLTQRKFTPPSEFTVDDADVTQD